MRRRNLSMLIAFLFIGNVSISYAQEENNEKDKFLFRPRFVQEVNTVMEHCIRVMKVIRRPVL